jgi:hypothetical protein
MRLYDISAEDVEAVSSRPVEAASDERGNPLMTGFDQTGRAIIVVIARDDPEFVITAFPKN